MCRTRGLWSESLLCLCWPRAESWPCRLRWVHVVCAVLALCKILEAHVVCARRKWSKLPRMWSLLVLWRTVGMWSVLGACGQRCAGPVQDCGRPCGLCWAQLVCATAHGIPGAVKDCRHVVCVGRCVSVGRILPVLPACRTRAMCLCANADVACAGPMQVLGHVSVCYADVPLCKTQGS